MGTITEENLHFKRLSRNLCKSKSAGKGNIRKSSAGPEN